MTHRRLLGAAVATCTLLGLARPAHAQQGGLELASCTMDVDIVGRTATTRMQQVWENHANGEREAVFHFALAEPGVVHDLALWINGVRSPAAVFPRVASEEIYRRIVNQRRDPALLVYRGGGQWELRVFPVPPKGERRVEVVCSHLMPVEQGRVIYRGPRATGGEATTPTLDVSARVRCPGGVRDLRTNASSAGVQVRPDSAVVVGYRVLGASLRQPPVLSFLPGQAPQPVIAWRDAKGRGRFWFTVPRDDALAGMPRPPRAFVLVVDTSESMGVGGVRAACAQAETVLAGLRPDDKFAVISARGEPALWRPGLVPAHKDDVEQARGYLRGLAAEGGTDLAGALHQAEGLTARLGGDVHVLVFTDGDDVVGARGLSQADPLTAARSKPVLPPGNLRLHWFLSAEPGVPHSALLPTGGHVLPLAGRELGVRVANGLLEDINARRPAGLHARLEGPEGMKLTATRAIPPAGRGDLVAMGQYAAGGNVKVALSAQVGGKSVSWEFEMALPDPPEAGRSWMGPVVSKLEAHVRAAELWRTLRTPDASLSGMEELVRLSRTQRIVTRATAMLVLESEQAYIERGIEPPGAVLARMVDLSVVERGRQVQWTVPPTRRKEIDAAKVRARALQEKGQFRAAADMLDKARRLNHNDFEAGLQAAILREYAAVHEANLRRLTSRRTRRPTTWGPWYQVLQPLAPTSFVPSTDAFVRLPKVAPLPQISPDDRAVRLKLAQTKIPKLEFDNIQLKDVLAFLHDATGLNIHPNWGALAVAGVDETTDVNLHLRNVSAGKAIETILQQLSPSSTSLAFEVDNGVLTISTREHLSRHTVTLIYDVRDLLLTTVPRVWPGRGSDRERDSGRGGFFDDESGGGGDDSAPASVPAAPARVGAAQPAAVPPVRPIVTDSATGAAGETPRVTEVRDIVPIAPRLVGRGEASLAIRPDRVQDLITIITELIDGTSWRRAGGEAGMIREWDGRLIVTQTRENHRKLAAFLAKLRAALVVRDGVIYVRPAMASWQAESLFTRAAGLAPWVLGLLDKARGGKMSKYSSVIVRKVGRRTFARIGGVWFDTALAKDSRIRLVAQGSPAAGALQRGRPELEKCFALGASVVVSLGDGLAVSLDEVGLADPKNPRFRPLLPAAKPGLPQTRPSGKKP